MDGLGAEITILCDTHIQQASDGKRGGGRGGGVHISCIAKEGGGRGGRKVLILVLP